MKIKANQKLTKAKRKVKMRGFYTPMPCIFILGFLHKKRKLVKSGENGPVSPYIIRKEKDFHEYLAKLYQVTAQHMEGLKAEKLHAAEKVFEIERILEEYSEDKKEDKVMDIMQCRAREAWSRQRKQQEHERMELLAKISDIEDVIAASETETKEIMISCKRRMEGKIAIYMEGAGLIEEGWYEFSEDSFVIDAYRNYVDILYLYETVSEGGKHHVI